MFVLLVVASCWMLFQKNPYQQHVFLTSANRASAVVYKGAGEVTSYFNLRSINSDLQERNATLEEMPKHVKFHRGDTIVTSGYSAVFPPGLIVGVIESNQQATDNNFFSLKIRLTTDFTRLGTVRAIKSKMAGELKRLEQEGGTDNE